MKKLLILSGKGGTGKTTTAAAFIRFADAKAIADCDVDAPNLHLITKVDSEPVKNKFYGSQKAKIDSDKCIGCKECINNCRFGAVKEIDNNVIVDEVFCEGCGVCEYVCPAEAVTLYDDIAGDLELYEGAITFSTATLKMGRGNSGKLVSEVKSAMLKSAHDTELAIIDGSPGIGCPVIASVTGVDLALIVAEPSVSGLSDLTRIIKTASALHAKTAVCVNKWDNSPQKTAEIEVFCKENDILFLGKVPYDKKASEAINAGISIADTDSPARDTLFEIFKSTMQILEVEL